MALPLPAPRMRSPSQWPGTARSAVSDGGSPIMTMGSRKRGRRDRPSPRDLRAVRADLPMAVAMARMPCLAPHVGDRDPLVRVQAPSVNPFGFVHVSTVPVHGWFLVLACEFGPTVVPRPSRVFGHSNHAGRLGEVHVR